MAAPSLVLDEPVDRWFSRPLARAVVALLARTPITANQVTGLASLAGIASGVALGLKRGDLFACLTAAFLVLDCCDGQLARLRGGGGMLGRVLDGVGDYLVGLAIHAGLIVWLAGSRGLLEAVVLGVAAGASMAWGAFLLDKYKRRFKGEVQDPAELEAAIAAHTGWRRAALLTMRPYLARLAREQAPAGGPDYQVRAAPAMRVFLLCGHTTHVTVWSVFAVLGEPLLYVAAAVLPFNFLVLLGLALQRRAASSEGVRAS
jgi:phosphatidylglycerophosphate synthase